VPVKGQEGKAIPMSDDKEEKRNRYRGRKEKAGTGLGKGHLWRGGKAGKKACKGGKKSKRNRLENLV